jgi:hemerythrin-like domain-containing protein
MTGGSPVSPVALPGHRAPAVGLEMPFEMLEACHERVQRSLQLLHKLQAYLADLGHDSSVAQAARDILRYFDVAAPLHHQDEELHVFPPLLALGDPALTAAVQRLQADHRAMECAWLGAAAVLRDIANTASNDWQPLQSAQVAALQNFAGLYGDHIALEEGTVYPRARAGITAGQLQAMRDDMVQRRTSS